MHRIRNRVWLTLVTAITALSLLACTPRLRTEGYLPDEDLVAQIKVGVSDRREVAQVLGSPPGTRIVSIDKSTTWYYVMRKTKSETFFKEEVTDQRVLSITFDQSGVVRSFRRYSLADARAVKPVGRTTPTKGRELGFLEQIFGNFGRLGAGAPAPE